MVFFGAVNLENEGMDDQQIQAFRFDSGISSGGCLGLPPDGFIVETPEEASIITFSINGSEISLGSAAYFQTISEDNGITMRVGLFEGTGFVTANGDTVRITAGQQTLIPLDSDLNPTGSPGDAEPFDTSSLDRMYAFVQSLEFDDGAEPVSDELCTISTDQSFTAGLHVGPGLNRSRRTWLDPGRVVTVTGISSDGQWWQLDKFEAFPSGANSVNELWVNVDDVEESGDCLSISTEAAPPIVRPPREAPTAVPTEAESDQPATGGITPQPPTEEVVEPIIDYWADDTSVNRSNPCTNINWYIEHVNAVYLSGGGLGQVPLSGISGSYEVCPQTTTTYTIQVVYQDGSTGNFRITIRYGFVVD
jgi:hypothetical protein